VSRPRTRRLLAAALLAGLLAGIAPWVVWWLDPGRGPPDVEALVALLRMPAHKAKAVRPMMRGGPAVEYSWPMKRLIEIGDPACGPLHRRITDEGVQNEVVLVLGEIGDESTVPLLIDAFPEAYVPDTPFDYSNPDPGQLKVICFTRALNQLTRHYIGHTEEGTGYEPGTRKKWQEWWAKSHKTFWVRDDSPRPNRTLKTVPQILAQLDLALTDEDAAVRKDAANSYAVLGPQAKPSVPGLIQAMRDSDPEVRKATASAFYFIGPDGAEAIPALLDLMRRDPVENVRWDAQIALSRIGRAALPPLMEMLTDESPEIRRRAIAGIGGMEPRQTWVLPRFHELARDADPGVRDAAYGYMGVIAPNDPCVFAALVSGLRDPVPEVRGGCAYDLGRIGPNASPATEALFHLLGDADPGVRRETLYAFDEIRSLTTEHVPALTKALGDETWEVRAAAARLLSKIGPPARPAVDALCVGLSDPEGSVRWWSAKALGAIGPDARKAVPLLIRALADPEHLVQSLAGDALKKINPAAAARAGVK
jgi:HEAT repeat protein